MLKKMLRPEASELEWEDLFPEQQEAYLDLEELLDAAVAAKNDTSKKRTNRIIFLDGVSGVGKTTVYLSLKANAVEKANDKEETDEKANKSRASGFRVDGGELRV